MKALILGGGGTLGAFSAGALQALESRGWSPELCIGSSAGGINLLRSTVGGADAAVEFWSSLDWKDLLREAFRESLFNGGLLGEKAFYERVERGVDFEALHRDPRQIGFLVVDMETGRVSVRGNRTEPSADALRTVSRAAYALPPLLPPVRDGERFLADGGLLHNAPLEAALRLGATEIVYLCNVQVLPHEGYTRLSTMPATGRYLDIFFRRASNVGFADQEITEHLWRGVPLLVIAPPPTQGLSSLLRTMMPSEKGLGALIELGRVRAKEAIDHFTTHGPGKTWPVSSAITSGETAALHP